MPPDSHPNFTQLWLRIGLLSFGGPAGQIALIHREVVERRGWIDDDAFLRALNFCMLLPGPEAQQLSVWCGWRLRGVRGGVIAGSLFVLPGALVMALLTAGYLAFGTQPLVIAGFRGIQAVVVAVVAQALWRIARRALHGGRAWALAAAAFAALWLLDAPFPLVVLIAGAIGWAGRSADAPPPAATDTASWRRSALVAAGWALLWSAPVAGCALWLGPGHPLTLLGGFFMRVAAFSFGGAYAALAYVAQAAVGAWHWLTPAAMLDGLGLAETTPGPLVLVFQFVGGVAGHGLAGPWPSAWIGTALGMALVVWVMFVPSFLWVFALAPHLDRLSTRPGPSRALAAITASIVGVMANLALWFALHVLFQRVEARHWGPLRLWVPSGGIDVAAAILAAAALLLLTRTRLGLAGVLALGTAAGVALQLASTG